MDAGAQIDRIIKQYPDWRGTMFSEGRKVIREADAGIVEEVKWKKPSRPLGTAMWSHDGPVCIVNAFKDKVNIAFFKGT